MRYFPWLCALLGCLLLFVAAGINTIPMREKEVNQSLARVINESHHRLELVAAAIERSGEAEVNEPALLKEMKDVRKAILLLPPPADILTNRQSLDKFETMQERMDAVLSRWLAVIKAIQDRPPALENIMIQLGRSQEKIETNIRRCNKSVDNFNRILRRFPGMIWARIYGTQPKYSFKEKNFSGSGK